MDDQLRLDCDGCQIKGDACGDCVVAVLLQGPPAGVVLDESERDAFATLADCGLAPPLHLTGGDGGTKLPVLDARPPITFGDYDPPGAWQRGA